LIFFLYQFQLGLIVPVNDALENLIEKYADVQRFPFSAALQRWQNIGNNLFKK
jgi:hypothetical protein